MTYKLIDTPETGDEVLDLLVIMSNEYIEYRNQIFDSCQIDDIVDDEDDAQYIYEMDQKIDRVLDCLEGLI